MGWRHFCAASSRSVLGSACKSASLSERHVSKQNEVKPRTFIVTTGRVLRRVRQSVMTFIMGSTHVITLCLTRRKTRPVVTINVRGFTSFCFETCLSERLADLQALPRTDRLDAAQKCRQPMNANPCFARPARRDREKEKDSKRLGVGIKKKKKQI